MKAEPNAVPALIPNQPQYRIRERVHVAGNDPEEEAGGCAERTKERIADRRRHTLLIKAMVLWRLTELKGYISGEILTLSGRITLVGYFRNMRACFVCAACDGEESQPGGFA